LAVFFSPPFIRENGGISSFFCNPPLESRLVKA